MILVEPYYRSLSYEIQDDQVVMRVGLLTKSGKIYTGCNVENAVYSLTICAERAAVFKAVSEGEREFDAIAVVTANGGSPCGSCRQVLAEFGPDARVLIAVPGKLVAVQTVAELLPRAFCSRDLSDSAAP